MWSRSALALLTNTTMPSAPVGTCGQPTATATSTPPTLRTTDSISPSSTR